MNSATTLDPTKVNENYVHYKYPFLVTDEVRLVLPKGARIRNIAQQPLTPPDSLQLWALIDKREPMVTRVLRIYGTGHACPPEPGVFLCTVLTNGGALVWHIYDLGEVR